MNPEVTVAVVGHEHRMYLERALSSIYASDIRRSFEVVFIDNDSRDGSAEFVEKAFPQVRLIRNLRRAGFARNNNLAFSVSKGKYFFALNPDTEVQKSAIESLAQFLDRSPDVGIVGPKLVFPNGGLQLSCRQYPTLRSFLWRRTPLRLLVPEDQRDGKHLMANFDHSKECSVDWLLGAALMMRSDLYRKLGGMDERYYLYCEDIDLCYRVHAAGFDVRYNPEATIIHDHLAETDKRFFSPRSISHYKSMFRYLVGHGVKLV